MCDSSGHVWKKDIKVGTISNRDILNHSDFLTSAIHQSPITTKMLSLFVVASFVLPSVLGHCCLPDKISMMAFTAGNPIASHVLVDFTQKKYLVTPDAGDRKYIFTKLDTGMQYTKYDDGSCTAEPSPVPFAQCIPTVFKDLGSNTLGKSMGTMSFGMRMGDDTVVYTVTDDCLPVLFIQTKDDETTTRVYYDIHTNVTDVSALNVDVSDCDAEA